MAYEPKDGDGSLFKNDKGNNDRRPDMTGRLLLNGTEYRLSAWTKEGQKGKWLSIRCELPREQVARGGGRSAAQTDDDIPF